MTLTMKEFQQWQRRTVLSPEETATVEAFYQQRAQMHGLGHAGGACCDSCAKGGPCEGCGHPASTCRCGKKGLGGFSGPVVPGTHAAPVAIMWGAGDVDSQDLRSSGFRATVDPAAVNRSLARPRGQVGLQRRVALTRMIEELEALTGTPGVSPEVLAQKVWAARQALMGAGDWSWADYADQRQAYDAKSDLEARLLVVERLLGVGRVAPALAGLGARPRMRVATGAGWNGGLGQGGGSWGTTYSDPVAKLASCIRGALCAPKAYCCPPGSSFRPPARTTGPQTFAQPQPGGTWSPPQPRIGDPYPPQPPPIGDRFPPPPQTPIGDRFPPLPQPRTPTGDLFPPRTPTGDVVPGGRVATPGGTSVPPPAIAVPSPGVLELPGGLGPGAREATPGGTGTSTPATAVAVPGSMPLSYPVSSGMVPVTQADPFAAEKARRVAVLKASATGGGAGRGTAVAVHGLGALPALQVLRGRLRQARAEIARRRA